MVEQSPTTAKQYGHKVDLYFIKQAGFQVLLDDIRPPCHRDIFVTCHCSCLLQGAFDPVRDKGKYCSPFLDDLFSGTMSDHKYRHVKGRVIAPRSLRNVEHSSAYHSCPCSS